MWTDKQVELLKQRWMDGCSCSAIAAELGITKNSVVGKVHRLQLEGRNKVKLPAAPRKPRRTTSYFRRAPPIVPAPIESEPVEFAVPFAQRCGLLDLNSSKCRWPVGDPGDAVFFFCGGTPVEGRPYCSYHSRCAFKPALGRRRDARWTGGQLRSI